MNRKKPKPPLLSTPCPFPGCDTELRAVFNPHTDTIRGYHGEEGLIDLHIQDLSPNEAPDADTLSEVQRTVMTLWGHRMGLAVAEFHAERGDR